MRISTKGTYALEIIVDLAMHSSEEHLERLKNIAARRGLSEKYLERIVKAMKNENLILSTRGAMGGYRLARRPEDITVLDVLRSVEGELAPVECLTKETNCGIACGGLLDTRSLGRYVERNLGCYGECLSGRYYKRGS